MDNLAARILQPGMCDGRRSEDMNAIPLHATPCHAIATYILFPNVHVLCSPSLIACLPFAGNQVSMHRPITSRTLPFLKDHGGSRDHLYAIMKL